MFSIVATSGEHIERLHDAEPISHIAASKKNRSYKLKRSLQKVKDFHDSREGAKEFAMKPKSPDESRGSPNRSGRDYRGGVPIATWRSVGSRSSEVQEEVRSPYLLLSSMGRRRSAGTRLSGRVNLRSNGGSAGKGRRRCRRFVIIAVGPSSERGGGVSGAQWPRSVARADSYDN
ncbi:uncharacterized protein LOC143182042 [Calliopsis andreniformis]|uniref:uncharacterized protein LOC143182042 n=1 Tax=Calliopsis andreniformis TaxID=337506 RepID=UPI003FCE3361